MLVQQLNEIVLPIYKQATGVTDIDTIESGSIVDMGQALLNASSVDNYVRSLVDVIGKKIFTNRKYQGSGYNVLMDSWEFGSIMEKIDCEIGDNLVKQNNSWSLTDGASYNQDTFYKPTVTAKFFNSKTTFEIDVSFTERQVKESFNSINELNSFISMIYNAVEKSFTVKLDGLIMSTINNMTAQVLNNEFPVIANAQTGSTVKAVNLLKLYNDTFTDATISKADCLTDMSFLKFASMIINNYVDRISKMSVLFNVGAKQRFTPREDLTLMMLSDFNSACNSYLQAETYHKELIELPKSESVPYWQGSGTNYDFSKTSKIDVNIKVSGTDKNIIFDGILAVMFDKLAVAVCNTDKRVTTAYNAKGEFFTNFYKFDCSYINDLNENFVVFYIGEAVAP